MIVTIPFGNSCYLSCEGAPTNSVQGAGNPVSVKDQFSGAPLRLQVTPLELAQGLTPSTCPSPFSPALRGAAPIALLYGSCCCSRRRPQGVARDSVLEADGVGARLGVLDGLEVVQAHPKVAQDGVPQLLELPCMPRMSQPQQRQTRQSTERERHISVQARATGQGPLREAWGEQAREASPSPGLGKAMRRWAGISQSWRRIPGRARTEHFFLELLPPLRHYGLQAPHIALGQLAPRVHGQRLLRICTAVESHGTRA